MRNLVTLVACASAGLGACAHAAPGAAPGPTVGAPVASAAPATSAACEAPEFRQLDFWLGDWDVVVHARKSPGVDEWADARGTQHVEKLLGGCAVAETFSAEGPGPAWAGRSYSVWQPQLGKWRQTWVDDQGSYLAFVGGVEDGVMALYGESRTLPDGTAVQMRMTWLDVRPESLRWEWQRSTDGGKSWLAMMVIRYTRR
jgi:hypothetical protein